ncbi:acetyltransferase [Biscogniauxia mediterranea]|nr:acetyltransferase [Biscogniauxia mediterranea]
MSSPDVAIRHARLEDAPVILSLLQEHAEYQSTYEFTSSSLVATLETVQNTIAFAPPESSGTTTTTMPSTTPTESLSPSRPARCLLLTNAGGEAVGLAVYFYSYSSWRSRPGVHIEDLYIKSSERGKGLGKRLLAALAREVVEIGGERLEWEVIKRNAPSIRFYEGLGAELLDEQAGMRLSGEELKNLANLY